MIDDLRVCFVGDSFVAGVGDPEHLGWSGRLAVRTEQAGQPLTTYGLGVRRETGDDVLARRPRECPPRLSPPGDGRVVVSFGVNDSTWEEGAPRVPSVRSVANWRAVLVLLDEQGWPALGVGPPPVADPGQVDRIADLDAAFGRACDELGVPYVSVVGPLRSDETWCREVRSGDGAHLGAEGYRHIADLVWPTWATWLGLEGATARPAVLSGVRGSVAAGQGVDLSNRPEADGLAFGCREASFWRLVVIEHMFDTGWVDDTAPPSPASVAALDACASAVAAEHAARHRTLVAVAALARTDAVAETGHRSLSRLLVERLHVDPGEARRLIRHAALLVASESTPFGPEEPVLPATSGIAAEGGLGAGHVEVIHRTVGRLQAVSSPLPPGVVKEVERQLADLARTRSPQQLADCAHEVLLRYDPDGEQPHDAERPVEELRTHTGRDGSFSGRFRFAEPETADLIRSAIEARTPAPDPETDTTPLRPGRSLDARRGEALRLLATDAGPADPHPDVMDDDLPADDGQPVGEEQPADEALREDASDPTAESTAPRPSRDRASRETTVIVTVDLDALTGDRDRDRDGAGKSRQGFGLLDGLHPLGPEAARRLACDAGIIPTVMGSRSEPLDLGRKTRVISTAQRRAVIARDRHCAHPGCRRSPRRCDIHHVIPWSAGGSTDVGNLVLLCPYHHHQHHHSDWHIEMRDGIPVFIPPAWLDPRRTPRTNRTSTVAA